MHVIRKLEALKRDTADTRQKYLKVLEQVHEHAAGSLFHGLPTLPPVGSPLARLVSGYLQLIQGKLKVGSTEGWKSQTQEI